MKKLCLVALVAMFSITTINAQGNINVGVNAGIPTGDVSDFYSFVVGVEANYLFEVSDQFQVGPTVSFVQFFGESIELGDFGGVDVEDASFLPIGGAARYNASEKIVLGLDLTYAVGISPDGNDGGFQYRPMFGYNVSEKIMLQASYSGISVDGGTFGQFGVGAMFSL
jgi:opacity protein-like surface antigen